MAILNRRRWGKPAARVATGLLGVAGLAWSAVIIPVFWSATSVESTARWMLSGASFKSDVVAGLLARKFFDPVGLRLPSLARAEAVLRLKAAELALSRIDAETVDNRFAQAAAAVEAALVIIPGDAFLWFARYWLAITREGAIDAKLVDLAASYKFGPREGWIAELRNGRALGVFSQLDPALQTLVVSEFAAMVEAGLITEATLNLMGPGWNARARLLAGLAEVQDAQKRAFMKALRTEGIRLAIPGLTETEERPW